MRFPPEVDCILINLDRSPDRLEQMKIKLAELNIPFRRLPGVDGKTLNFTEQEINISMYEKVHGAYATSSEIGCYLSHYNALKSFLAGDKQLALILEDDMFLAQDVVLLVKELTELRDCWDMVKLNGTDSWAMPVTHKSLSNGYKLVTNWLHEAKAGMYLVNRRAAKRFVSGLLPMTVPYDHEFLKFWKYEIRQFTVKPFPAREEGILSTIDSVAQRRSSKKAWYRRGSTLVYRTEIMLQRLWHSSKMPRFQPSESEGINANSSPQSSNK